MAIDRVRTLIEAHTDRSGGLIGAPPRVNVLRLNLALDDRPFAQIKAPRFTAIAVPPGEHVLTAGFGGLAGPQNKTNFSKVTFQPGQVLAVKAGVAMGVLTNTIKLEPAATDDALRNKLRRMPMVRPE